MDDCCHRWIRRKLEHNRICENCGKSYFEWSMDYINQLENEKEDLTNQLFEKHNELIDLREKHRDLHSSLANLIEGAKKTIFLG